LDEPYCLKPNKRFFSFCQLDQKALATLLQLFAKGNFVEQDDGLSDGTEKLLADDTTLDLTVVADDSEETAADDNSVTLADDNVNSEIVGVLLEALSESGQLDFDDIVKCKIHIHYFVVFLNQYQTSKRRSIQ